MKSEFIENTIFLLEFVGLDLSCFQRRYHECCRFLFWFELHIMKEDTQY